MAVHAATKAFVLSFTEALAHELRDAPVRVLALSLGATRSEFFATSRTSEAGLRFQTPEQVVATALRALDARRRPTTVVSGRVNRLATGASCLLPRRVVLEAMARGARPAH